MKTPTPLFRLGASLPRDPAIELWMEGHPATLGGIARRWFECMRRCGGDVRERLHDGWAVACVADAPFAYVGVFKAHVNVGFFRGAELPDPAGLLQGSGQLMRHVKLTSGDEAKTAALGALIAAAYSNIQVRLRADRGE